ncbi:MAG: iron ABC transporter permease [Desulforhabdus sp.]|nr:iron ABC transporter permease [Desulforhabdus sp.]
MSSSHASSNLKVPLLQSYRRSNAFKMVYLLTMLLCLALSVFAGLLQGASSTSWSEALTALWDRSGRAHLIVWQLRLPRIAMGCLIGWGLALGGAACQTVLRNPLASPFTLGVASGAGFGAVLGIIWGFGRFQQEIIALSAFLFALLTILAVLTVAQIKGASPETLILAGVATMFLFSALTSLLQYIGTFEEVHAIVFWMFGSLSKVGWNEIALAVVMILPASLVLYFKSWDLNLLIGGDETAQSLGVNAPGLRKVALVLSALMTAGAICFTGIIGFVGLVSPHIGRMLIGADHRYLIPASGVIGALLVVTADTLSRTVWMPQIIPIGIVTSFLGVPFFFYLLLKKTREYW